MLGMGLGMLRSSFLLFGVEICSEHRLKVGDEGHPTIYHLNRNLPNMCAILIFQGVIHWTLDVYSLTRYDFICEFDLLFV